MVAVPLDGRITSLPQLTAVVSGMLFEVVSPGNAASGVNYQATVDLIAAWIAMYPYQTSSTVTSGGTVGSPYLIEPTDTRVLFNKGTGSASYATAPLASQMVFSTPLLIKDIKGDAATNPITVSFTSGQLCDGQSTIVINAAYGWIYISPLPDNSGWYQSG